MTELPDFKRIISRIIPARIYRPVLRYWRRKPHFVRWGNLRQLTPISQVFGLDRGQPIYRYYIEQFLSQHSIDIRDRVLEIADANYTCKFGGNRVSHSDVLHVVPGNPHATIVGNLATGEGIPKETFDCIILTETLQFIYDVKAAIANIHAALHPGGVVLATFPCISQISRYDMERWGDYWRFTSLSAQRLFEKIFPKENITIVTYGNILVATACLHGVSAQELTRKELDYQDPDYQVIITVRAVK